MSVASPEASLASPSPVAPISPPAVDGEHRNCRVYSHPVLAAKLGTLRDKNTEPSAFRGLVSDLGRALAYEVTRDLSTHPVEVQTPMAAAQGVGIADKVVVVCIMRAGSGMVGGFMQMLPFAGVGHVGIYRDKHIHNTVEYYFRMPQDVEGARAIVVDPLLATGATAVAAITRLRDYGVGRIDFACILAAPEGLARMYARHPEVMVHTLSVEEGLDANGYILPGVGDAGDRLYGTD